MSEVHIQCRRKGAIPAPNIQVNQCQRSAILKNSKHKINKWLLKPHFCWRALVVTAVVLLISHRAIGQLLPPPKKLHRIIAGFYAYHPSYDTDKKAPIASTNKHSPTVVSPPVFYDQQQPKKAYKPRKRPTLSPVPVSRPPKLASQPNAVHYHSYHTEHNLGGNYNFHHLNSDTDRHQRPKLHAGEGYHHYHSTHSSKYKKVKKYKKEEEYYKSKTKYKSSKKYHHKNYRKYRQKGSSGGYTTGGFHSAQYHLPDWAYISKVYEGYLVLARRMAEYYGEKYHYPPHLLYWQIIGVMFEP